MEKYQDDMLLRIARNLIVKASFIDDLGLYHGKMGIVIFFAHYGKYSGDPLYEDFAGELLDEIYEEIHKDTGIDFESGLCGIGWGIEYLLQNGFMEGDSDDVLIDLDKLIMRSDIRHITDQSFRTGMKGISFYIQKRMNSPCRNPKNKLFDEAYLKEWGLLNDLNHSFDDNELLLCLLNEQPERENVWEWDLGLYKGCAGYGLKRLLQ